MGRPREFDTETALSGAMDVFWALGYAGAALPDLLDGMGITRGSLYKAFGDKKSLFLEILRRYEAEAVDPAIALLCDPSLGGHDRVAALFDAVLDGAAGGDRRGCLLCTAAAGAASEDRDIGDAVRAMLIRMRDGFEAATGDRATAEMLLTHYVGLRIMVRSGAPLQNLRAASDALVAVLPSDAPGT